ncbi:hypothetical protein BDW02DRAFT_46784 [Decorospora gaudefroyi]|uniref:Uncharacterized protein n=1 Tax=Decorospora gaudefroyi TaxID=184978 RepID=A0A6A5K627_9PLEO|nr:hypothetical protein BDW02DRAFT_46784 [Decorospora gaudefroyi]
MAVWICKAGLQLSTRGQGSGEWKLLRPPPLHLALLGLRPWPSDCSDTILRARYHATFPLADCIMCSAVTKTCPAVQQTCMYLGLRGFRGLGSFTRLSGGVAMAVAATDSLETGSSGRSEFLTLRSLQPSVLRGPPVSTAPLCSEVLRSVAYTVRLSAHYFLTGTSAVHSTVARQ